MHVIRFLSVFLLAALVANPVSAAQEKSYTSSVVQIYTFVFNKKTGEIAGLGSGTGFLVNDKGVVATNDHVVKSMPKDDKGNQLPESQLEFRYVIVEDGAIFDLLQSFKQPNASLIWSSRSRDLALLQATGLTSTTPATLTRTMPDQGEDIIASGYPAVADRALDRMGVERQANASVTSGVLGRILADTRWDGAKSDLSVTVIQHSASINNGNSGGPLFDRCHRVIGVNTASAFSKDGGVSGIFYASQINELIKELERRKAPFNEQDGKCAKGVVEGQTPPPAPEPVQSPQPAPEPVHQPQQGSLSTPTLVGLLLAGLLTLVAVAAILMRRGSKPREEPLFPVQAPIAAQPVSGVTVDMGVSAATVDLSSNPDAATAPVVEILKESGEVLMRVLPADFLKGPVTFGREAGQVDFVLPDERGVLSRRHFSLSWKGQALWLTDLGSKNGTFVDQRRLAANEPVKLDNGGGFMLANVTQLSIKLT